MPADDRQHWPACERNKGPILDVLRRVLPARGLVLEVASGTSQHAVHFAAGLPALAWQPTDVDETYRRSVVAWIEHAGVPNVRAPVALDVTALPWPFHAVDAVFNANMVHIAPWSVCEGLMAGAAAALRPGGVLIVYGPFRVDGAHTAPSNEAFDASLRERDPAWGVRDREAIVAEAEGRGLVLEEIVHMPANNQLLVFRRA
jgi:SAM-dependent methyltransferase